MVQSLSRGNSRFWAWVKHSRQQLKLSRVHLLLHFVSEVNDAFVILFYYFWIGTCEQILSENQFVKNGPNTEHVADRMESARIKLFVLYFQNLWGNVTGSTASDKQIFWLFCQCRQVEVDDFDLLLRGDQDVFWFQVSVENTLFGHVPHGLQDLSEYDGYFILADKVFALFFFVGNVLLKGGSLNILQNKVQDFVLLKYSV